MYSRLTHAIEGCAAVYHTHGLSNLSTKRRCRICNACFTYPLPRFHRQVYARFSINSGSDPFPKPTRQGTLGRPRPPQPGRKPSRLTAVCIIRIRCAQRKSDKPEVGVWRRSLPFEKWAATEEHYANHALTHQSRRKHFVLAFSERSCLQWKNSK
jgi:hypothetical protein